MTLLNEAHKIYLGTTEVNRVYAGANMVYEKIGTGGPIAPTASLVTAYTPGTDRNDFTGQVGVRIGIGAANISISWIGARRHSASQTGVHTLKLYEWFADALERTGTVNFDGVAVGSYAWGAVTPYTLLAGGYYGLMMDVVASDGQMWCNPGPVTMAPSIVNIYDIYRISGPPQTGLQNSMFNGLDLGWT